MTEEQIKQNAERYAINSGYEPLPKGGWIDCTAADTYGISVDSYIEGAHSRNEEIKELKLKLANKSGEVADIEVENALLKIKLKLNKFHNNHWISVDERLPEEDKDNNGYSVKVIGMFANGGISDCFCSLDENIWFIDGLTCDKPTHWMQIPNLNCE